MSWIEQLRLTNWTRAGCIGLAAYALGCFTTGYYLVRWRTGQDVREAGSGSKGMLAVWWARHFTTDDRLLALAMLGVVAGHLWPVQLRLRGGKGMATSFGALLIFDWKLAVAFVLLFLGALAVMRKPVLPGLFALACLPFASLLLGRGVAEVAGCSILAGMVLMAHRRNLGSEISLLLERRQANSKHDPPKL